MTVDQIIEAALARAMEFSKSVPNTFSVSLARLNAHQEQLFADTADQNRDYFGADGVLVLTTGACDTGTLNPLPMRVVRVVVSNPGTSGYLAERKINIVPIDDVTAANAPRATLRGGLITQVGTELATVTSVKVYYSRRPTVLTAKGDTPDFPAQYHDLLVIDLTKQLIRKTVGLTATARDEVVQVIQTEYDEIAAMFAQHLRNFNYAETSRFGATAQGGRQ